MSLGVSLSLIASILFGTLYYFSTLLKPLSGEDIFAWRMILTAPFILIFVYLANEQKLVTDVFNRLLKNPSFALVLILSSALMGLQLWLFLWAPTAGKALEVSLGYFMLPLTLVITGRILYREKLSTWQLSAALIAAIGVAHEIYRINGFSAPALTVALGYPVYFVLRKKFKIDHVGGLWFDLVLMLPVAIWLATQGQINDTFIETYPKFYYLLPIFGLLSASALITYIVCVKHLSLGLFGLLGYVEPVLLLLVALMLGEEISSDEVFTYGPIWVAVGILITEGIISQFKKIK
jgi:chloramphenicol-sensitive protein RarD